MLALIVEGSVPAEVLWLDVHSGSDFIAICSEQVPPRFGVVIAKTRSVLTLQGEDMRPHIPVVLVQFLHCLLYTSGNAVNKDTARAADWFTKSAEAGNQYAQYMLGKLCLTGQGQPRDQAKAMVWFSRSDAQGNQYAQFFLEQRNDLHPPSVMLAVTRLLYHMSRIFQDNSVPSTVPTG